MSCSAMKLGTAGLAGLMVTYHRSFLINIVNISVLLIPYFKKEEWE